MRENASRIAFPIPKGLNLSAQGWIAGEKGAILPWGNVAAENSNSERVASNSERVASTACAQQDGFMAQSLSKVIMHTVFSTKERRPFLRDPAVREELHR